MDTRASPIARINTLHLAWVLAFVVGIPARGIGTMALPSWPSGMHQASKELDRDGITVL